MFYLYILKFENGKLYTGVTNNLKRRLIEHKNGRTKWTKWQGDFILIHKEEFSSLSLKKSGSILMVILMGIL